ncbi:MAG TPA: TonB C-terminal domain-containing protein [Oculatellaceae cyanobacterium]
MFSRQIFLLLLSVAISAFVAGGEARAKFLSARRTERVDQETRCINIQQRIGGAAKVDVSEFNKRGFNATIDRMKVLLGEKPIACKLILNPDGSIVDIQIARSSGSKKNDDEAVRIIRAAGPFYSSKLSVPLAYMIGFPKLHVGTSSI